MRPLRFVLATLALAALGCSSLKPDYQRPELPLPEAYSAAGQEAAIADAWWTGFGDPALDRLLDEALAANQNLALAVARVDEARARVGLADADRYPTVSAVGSAARLRFSGDNPQIPPGIDLTTSSHRATVAVAYEADFWGRYKSGSKAARADLLATEAGERTVRLALEADVVTAYLDLLTFERQRGVSLSTVESRRGAVRLQQARFDAGTISELDLAQAQAELAAAEATVPVFERAVRQTEGRLAVLLGRVGGRVERGASFDAVRLPEVPVGLPSQLLARRPDVVAAELGLIAANARVAQARAAYFPLIALTAEAGSESLELADLLSSGTGVWQAVLSVVQPIFTAGRTKRQVEAAQARERQALAVYTGAVQRAFAEVEDALVGRTTSVAEREALARQVEARTRARRLANLRYEAGDSSYLEVLDADRNLFQAELALTRARRDELAAAVRLFQALGGGWASEAR